MALTARCVITLAQAKEYLGIIASDGSKDTMLESWIDLVSGKFEADTGVKVQAQDTTAYLDGSGDNYLYLKVWPIVRLYGTTDADKLANLQYRSSPTGTWTDLVDDMDYVYIDEVHPERIELLEDVFPAGYKNIRVRYYAGNSTVPADIQIVIMEAIQMMWAESKQGGDRLGKANVASPASSGGTSEGLLDWGPRWDKIVRKYAKWVHNVEMYR